MSPVNENKTNFQLKTLKCTKSIAFNLSPHKSMRVCVRVCLPGIMKLNFAIWCLSCPES